MRSQYDERGRISETLYFDHKLMHGIGIVTIHSNENDPMNIENPGEFAINQLAELVAKLINSLVKLIENPCRRMIRCRIIWRSILSTKQLGWTPMISLHDGLYPTIAWSRESLNQTA